MMPSLLALLFTLISVTQVVAGIWTSNNFFYKPGVGARGKEEAGGAAFRLQTQSGRIPVHDAAAMVGTLLD